MNTTRASGSELAKALVAKASADLPVDVLVCPPFPYLHLISGIVDGSSIELGAQDVYFEKPGAFTGEVSTEMLCDVGCRFVILGHSERRHVLGESDELVGRKVQASLAAGLQPVVCIGELLSEREGGLMEAVLERQLAGALNGLTPEQLGQTVIAYEPVWAIGTGVTASPEQAQDAHALTRAWLRTQFSDTVADEMRILYGGSVKPDNAATLLSQPDVDGALVGGASLVADSFQGIIDAAVQVSAG